MSPYRQKYEPEERKLPFWCRLWGHNWVKTGETYGDDDYDCTDDRIWARCRRCGKVKEFEFDVWYEDYAPPLPW